MSLSSRLHRPLAAVVLGAALLVPLQPPVSALAAPGGTHSTAAAKPSARATQTTLTAYGDTDASGAVHLSGSLRWADGSRLGHKQVVELWGRSGTAWVVVRKVTTDTRGDVELSVRPGAHTAYQLRFAGVRGAKPASSAARSQSRAVTVRTVARVTLVVPARAKRGETFAVSGKVTPAGAGRLVTLAGNGRTFTTLRTRADGSYGGHVRLQMTTTLSVVLPDTAALDGAVSGPHTVRVV